MRARDDADVVDRGARAPDRAGAPGGPLRDGATAAAAPGRIGDLEGIGALGGGAIAAAAGRVRSHAWSLTAWLVAALAALSRLPFRSQVPYNWDSVQYILGMQHFDVAAHQPHPPGNPLYILIARAVDLVLRNPNQSLVAISIASTVGVVGLTAVLGRRIAGPAVGLWAALLVAVNPLFWLYGDVALSYVPEAAVGTLVALVVWEAHQQASIRSAVILGLTLAFAGGLRPTVLVLLVPLWAFGLWRSSWRVRLAGAAVAGIACLLWLVPLLAVSGGPTAYLTQLRLLSSRIDSETTIGAASLTNWLSNVEVLVLSILVGVNVAAIPAVVVLVTRRVRLVRPDTRAVFLGLWVFPAVAVFALLHLGQVGYVLLILPPLLFLCLMAVERAWPGFTDGRRGVPLLCILAAAALGLTTVMLPGIPRHDQSWTAIDGTLTRLDPRQTVLVAADDQVGVFRIAGYLRPDVHTFGVAHDPTGAYGVLYDALDGHSSFHLDPALRACQVVRLQGVRNVVVTGASLTSHIADGAGWTRTRLADGSDMLTWSQPGADVTLVFAADSLATEPGLQSGTGLTCSATTRAPLRALASAGR